MIVPIVAPSSKPVTALAGIPTVEATISIPSLTAKLIACATVSVARATLVYSQLLKQYTASFVTLFFPYV